MCYGSYGTNIKGIIGPKKSLSVKLIVLAKVRSIYAPYPFKCQVDRTDKSQEHLCTLSQNLKVT